MPTHADETEAEQELKRLGYDETIFSFDHVPEHKLGASNSPESTHVIVTNTESRDQKLYSTGGGAPWITSFIRDVEAGAFGPPPKGLASPPK